MNRMRDSLGDGYPSPNGVKRSRMDDSFENFSRLSGPVDFRSSGMGNDSNNPPSSRVLAVKNLSDSVMEADLVDALSHFGSVSYVQLIGRGSGLVEFEELQSAERVVSYNLTTDIMVLNQPAMFTFSNLQIIPRQGYESERPSHVLVIYVQNAKYPITTDVINAICKPVSRVLRIMIMRDNGIQCLVEFNDIESARLVKQRLNGCDIYSGCCTLKIEYSKLTRLHVTKNDSDTSDYVTPPSALNPQPTFSALPKDRPALLSEPPVFTGPSSSFRQGQGQGRSSGGFPGDERRFDDFPRPDLDEPPRFPGAAFDRFASETSIGRGGRFDDFNEFSERGSGSGGHFGGGRPPLDGPFGGGNGGGLPLDGPFGGGGGGRNMGQSIFQDIEPPRFSSGNSGPPRYNDMPMGFPSGGGGGGGDMRHKHDGCGMGDDDAVLMIYGLNPEKINCDRLFNLFCQYGNVVRIKFLKSKNDTVMIQMGDPVAAQRAIDHLKNALVFGGRMSVNLSRQNRLNEVREPAELPDKTSSYKDFTNNRNNRFLSPEIAAKNRINPPQKYLYFFNAPPQVNEEELREIFQTHDAPKPVSIKIFEKKGNFAKNSAGIIEFENEDESIEAIMLCNHLPIDSKTSKTPFVWKLCFAGPPSSNVMGEGGDGGGGFSRPPNMPNNYNGPAFARGGGRGGSGGGRGGSVGGRGGSGGSRGGDDRGRGRSPPRGSGGPPRGGGGMQRGGGSSGGAPRFGGGPGSGSGPYYAGSGADRGRGGSGGGRGRGRSY